MTETTYTIAADGRAPTTTTDADYAESMSRMGARVTARTETNNA